MARARSPVPSLYVVQRIAVHAYAWGEDPTLYANEPDRRQTSGVPLRGFAAKKPADALCRELERQARRTTSIGPFLRGLIPENMDEVIAAAKAAGLPGPDLSKAGPVVEPRRTQHGVSFPNEYWEYRKRVEELVAAWWTATAADVTPEANAKLWKRLFPEHRFYTVVRVLVEE
jgi:hypothetical protein